ncbi:MAG: alpha/beta hydrolase [Bdellovibrionota bacterium]
MGAKKILRSFFYLNFLFLMQSLCFNLSAAEYFSHLTVEDAQKTINIKSAEELKGIGPHLIEIHNNPLFGSNIVLRAHYFKAVGAKPKALVLGVHGLQSNARWFMQSGTALAKQGISVLVYDRRGSGLSDGNKRFFGLPIDFDPNPNEIKVAEGLRGHVKTGIILKRLVFNSAKQFMSDIDASFKKLVELNKDYSKDDGKSELDVYILANCFGSRIAIPYAKSNKKIKSLIVTAPATDMDPRANVESIIDKVDIALPLFHFLGPEDYIKSPLQDSYFVSPENPAYAGIVNNKVSLSLRYATGDFFWATRSLTKKMYKDIPKLEIPMLIFLGSNDMMVDNEAIKNRFRDDYQADGKIVTLRAEHMLEFTPAGSSFFKTTAQWILEDQRTGKPTNIEVSNLPYVLSSENIGSAKPLTPPVEIQAEVAPERRGFFSRLFKRK